MKFFLQILLANLFFVLVLSQFKEDFDEPLVDEEKMAKFKRSFQKLKKFKRHLEEASDIESIGSEESDESESSGESETTVEPDTTNAGSTSAEPDTTNAGSTSAEPDTTIAGSISGNTTVDDTTEDQTTQVATQRPTPIPSAKVPKKVKLMGFNSFNSKRTNNQPVSVYNPVTIVFRVFLYFINIPMYPFVSFTLRITQHSLRELQETTQNKTVQCRLNNTAVQGSLAPYDCETNSTIEPHEVSSNGDYKFADDSGKEVTLVTDDDEGIEVPDEVEKIGENIQLQNTTTFSYVVLQNVGHYVEDDGKTFHITGQLTGTDTKKVISAKIIPVIFYKEGTNTPITIQCTTSGDADVFNLKCVAPQNFNAKLNDCKAQVGDTPITFSASTEDANNLKITGAGNTSNNNVYYRKNYSGLSGGVIAAIVIPCAVFLILVTILAMYLRRPKPAMDNNSTIVGLRSVDNYQE